MPALKVQEHGECTAVTAAVSLWKSMDQQYLSLTYPMNDAVYVNHPISPYKVEKRSPALLHSFLRMRVGLFFFENLLQEKKWPSTYGGY